MSNQTTKEADDIVVDKVEEGISNEEADAPATTADDDANQPSSVEEEVSPSTLPWWKQKHVLVIGIVVLVIILVVAIVLGVTLSSSNNNCFNADDGGQFGILYSAVRSYVSQDCANNKECDIGQKYGWPLNSWCVGSVKDMSYLLYNIDTFNENISDWNTSNVTDMAFMFYHAKIIQW